MSSGDRQARPRAFLDDWCRRMDGGPYPAYRDLHGLYTLDGLRIEVLRVQPDPFAGPSRIRLLVPAASTALDRAWFGLEGGAGAREPGVVDRASARAVAARDLLGRTIGAWLAASVRTGPHGPEASIQPHGQEVLDRSAVLLHPDHVEIRLQVDLPARGRRILGRGAAGLLLDMPERLVREILAPGSLDPAVIAAHADVVEDFAALQEALEPRGWIGFVAEGARLARRAGNDDRPLVEGVVPFEPPAEMRAEISLPHAGRIFGMALPPGVTLLCGGGFHGKSTLLRALASGVVPHVAGDGRERVAVRADAQSVRAEDGRAVTGVDLRPFLHDLPFGRDAGAFTTENASGSTSQAAGIIEAVQAGARVLLMDEDTSATNFMIRDALMERLIRRRAEPITPFLEQARTLAERLGVSSVLVIGGSGEYFRVADRVLVLDTYRPFDRTEEARRIASERPSAPADPASEEAFRKAADPERPVPPGPPGEPRIKALDARRLLIGGVPLDLSGLESLRDLAQARFLGRVLSFVLRERPGGREQSAGGRSTEPGGSFRAFGRRIAEEWRSARLDGFDREIRGDLAAVRIQDLAAAAARLRSRPAPGSERSGDDHRNEEPGRDAGEAPGREAPGPQAGPTERRA